MQAAEEEWAAKMQSLKGQLHNTKAECDHLRQQLHSAHQEREQVSAELRKQVADTAGIQQQLKSASDDIFLRQVSIQWLQALLYTCCSSGCTWTYGQLQQLLGQTRVIITAPVQLWHRISSNDLSGWSAFVHSKR